MQAEQLVGLIGTREGEPKPASADHYQPPLEGDGIMVIGDWGRLGDPGAVPGGPAPSARHLALFKGGNLHGLMNPADQRASLFMFGGWD